MIIKKEELQKALELVKPGLSNKEFIEQSTCFAFMGDRVVTYNDEISISHPIDGLELTGAIKADELYQLLSKLTRDEITIDIDEKEIRIKGGRAKAGLLLQEKISLPIDEIGEIKGWKPLPAEFLEAVKFTIPSASSDMSRPALTCLNVRQDGKVEASDNLRFTRFQMDQEMPITSFLIPANVAKELIRYPVVEIADGLGWKHFQTQQGTVFSCRVFEDIFPDVDEAGIMKVQGFKITFPKTMTNIVDRASVLAKRMHSLDAEISVLIANEKVTVKGASDYGWFEETANIKYSGDPISFLIHPDFLKEMLPKIQSCVVGKRSMKFTGENWEHVVWLKEN